MMMNIMEGDLLRRNHGGGNLGSALKEAARAFGDSEESPRGAHMAFRVTQENL